MAFEFNETQFTMAIFLTVCTVANSWMIYKSIVRISHRKKSGAENPQTTTTQKFKQTYEFTATEGASGDSGDPEEGGTAHRGGSEAHKLELFEHALLMMAVMDWPWVTICALQCWINTLTTQNAWHQASGNDSFGCMLMGYYSTFSIISMMASNISVAYYHPNTTDRRWFQATGSNVVKVSLLGILPVAIVFAAIPLMSTGFALTDGGFCYADWADPVQSSFILIATSLGVGVGAYRWRHVLKTTTNENAKCHLLIAVAMFIGVWSLWVVASIYALIHNDTPDVPYMLIGGIMGHMQALLNPLFYGFWMYNDVRLSSSVRGNTIEDLLSDNDSVRLQALT